MDFLSPSSPNRIRTINLVVVMTLFALVIGAAIWARQQNTIDLVAQNASLDNRRRDLEARHSALKFATNMPVDQWATYCDPINGHCFKHPADWLLSSGADTQFNYVSAAVESPDHTLKASYDNPYNKDAGFATFHTVYKEDFKVGDLKLVIVGGYYLESVVFGPFFVLVNESDAADLVVNKNSVWVNNMRYEDEGGAIKMNAQTLKPTLVTPEQANAWFESLDGITALSIIRSFHIR